MRKPRSHSPTGKSNIFTQGKKQRRKSNPVPPYYPLPPHNWTTPNGASAPLLDLYMKETAKIPDEEAVNNQDQDGGDLPKDFTYEELHEMLTELEAYCIKEACISITAFTACCWALLNIVGREFLLYWRTWKQSNETLHETMLAELKTRTPHFSRSDEDFNAAWEAIRGEHPSLIASLSHFKDKFLRSWKQRKIAFLELQAEGGTAACLADGYTHTRVGRVVSEGSESGSTTQQSMQTVVVVELEPRLPKSGSPSTSHNFISKLLGMLLRLRRTVW